MKDKDQYPEGKINRRRFFASASLAAGSFFFAGNAFSKIRLPDTTAGPGRLADPRYPIGVCDWMILKRQKLGAFPLASTLGADGVEVDMGGLGNRVSFDNHLNDPAVRKQFMDTAASLNLKICSLAMSGFYAQSFSRRPGVIDLVTGCIGNMKELGVKVAFLPLGIRDDLSKYPEIRPLVVKRLKAVAPIAEKAGVVIGIETALDARGELELLGEVGSRAIQSYFNFENPLQAGRDLCREMEVLGKENICQIHCTDKDGVWLEDDPLIDMNRVRKTLDSMGWKGWLVMERSRDQRDPHDVKKNYGANARYLKKIFQSP